MLAQSKSLTSYDFTECVVKIGDIFERTDYNQVTYAVMGITELTWRVGKKKTKKCEYLLDLFAFQSGKMINVNVSSFRKYYLYNSYCKKIWSADVSNKRNDYVD